MSWSRFSPTLHRGLAKSRAIDCAFRREMKEERAFVFWHKWTHNWVLGVWSTRRGERGIHEFRVLNHDPTFTEGPRGGRATMAEVRRLWLQPSDFGAGLQRVKSEEHDQFMAEYEWQEELIRKKQFAGRQVNHVRRQNPWYMLHSHKR